MKERGIIFAGESVRAILDGRKTQTRRVVKPRHDFYVDEREGGSLWPYFETYVYADPEPIEVPCPYGVPGDRLYVKESGNIAADGTAWMYADHGGKLGPGAPAGSEDWAREWKPRSSMFMPRWASRITLEVVAVRVERLCSITENDALAEIGGTAEHGYRGQMVRPGPIDAFEERWDSINGKRAPWTSNPWVWVVEFRRLP